MIIIKNARIHTMAEAEFEKGFIICEDGKILKLGSMEDFSKETFPEEESEDIQIIDAEEFHVFPGLIDAHCHVGMQEDGVADEGEDVNEDTDPVTPHLNAADGIYFMDRSFQEACRAGVTTCVTGPGSANVIGGRFAAVKTDNRDISKMVLKENAAMKFAFGQNPKFVYGDKKITPATRMAGVAMIREALYETEEYHDKLDEYKSDPEEKDKPDYDIKKEALLPVLSGKMIVKAHAHRADDMLSAIKLSKQFGYPLTIEHGTEGHLIVDYLKQENVQVIYGPVITERCKTELKHHDVKTPGILSNAGIKTAIMTDHPCVPIQYLALSAMLAVKHGMSKEDARKAITITAAELTGIQDRVGSLEAGKDADLIITDGDILAFETQIRYTIINGKIAYDAADQNKQ